MTEFSNEGFSAGESLSRLDGRGGDDRWLTPASIGISIAIVAAFAYFLPYLYLKLNLRAQAGGYLPVLAVFPFLLLLALNGLVRRLGFGLRRGELTVVLCVLMVSLSTLLTASLLTTALPAPVRHATAGNKFGSQFLWAMDTRLLPYTMEDKEREKKTGQFDESMNWYYMGVPDPLPEPEQRRPVRGRTTIPAGATTTPASVKASHNDYDPALLKTPWWRWARRFDVEPEERVAGYVGLAERIKDDPYPDAVTRETMLASVDELVTNVKAVRESERAHETLENLADGHDALEEAVERERDVDERLSIHVRVDPTGTALDRAALTVRERLRDYDRLAGRVANTPGLAPETIREMIAAIDVLKKNVRSLGTAERAYEQLVGRAREVEARSLCACERKHNALRAMIEAERETDQRIASRKQPADPAGRKAAYGALERRIKKMDGLTAETVERMLEQVKALRTADSAAAREEAYDGLLGLADGAYFDEREERRALKLAILRERDTDRHIAVDLQIPPDRLDTNRAWFLWTGPLLWWTVLLVLFLLLQFCLVALLRRQWVDHEKLLFPHVEVLEAVTEPGAGNIPGGGIVRNPWMWAGFAFAFLLFALEGISTYIPAVPGLKPGENFSLNPLLTDRPWNAIPGTLDLHVFVIAIAFLLPAEISFSVWIFVLLDFAVRVYMQATGQTHHVYEPIQGYLLNGGTDQLAGLTVFVVALIFGGRRHFWGVIRKAFGGGKDIDDSEEPLPYAGAFWGLVFSALAILLWCYVMGMSPLLAIVLFGLTILGVIFLARLVCELGIVTGTYQEPSMPQYLLAGSLGYRSEVGRLSLTRLWLYMTPTYAMWAPLWPALFYGTHAMPLVLTAERMYGEGRTRRRFTGLLLALTLAVLGVFMVRTVSIPYEEGAIKLKQGRHDAHAGNHTYNNCLVRDFIRKERMHKPVPAYYLNAIVGAVVVTLLLALRHLFYWWPLHPIGYLCAGLSGGVWFSVFLGWLIKRSVLKYGGGRLFRTAIPLFVGLLVGHFVIAGIWTIVGVSMEAAQLEGTYSAIWCQPYGR
jgi:hypothetical protein